MSFICTVLVRTNRSTKTFFGEWSFVIFINFLNIEIFIILLKLTMNSIGLLLPMPITYGIGNMLIKLEMANFGGLMKIIPQIFIFVAVS